MTQAKTLAWCTISSLSRAGEAQSEQPTAYLGLVQHMPPDMWPLIAQAQGLFRYGWHHPTFASREPFRAEPSPGPVMQLLPNQRLTVWSSAQLVWAQQLPPSHTRSSRA